MSIEENKALVRRFIDEVENKVNLGVMNELLSPDFVDHGSYGITCENLSKHIKDVRASFPNAHLAINRLVAEGDLVAAYLTFAGTHEGPFLGVKPTGRRLTFDVLMLFRVEDGRLREHWGMVDQLIILQQLGLVGQYDWP